MKVKYAQQFDVAGFLEHFLGMKHWNSYETIKLVLGSNHQHHYALIGVFGLFTIYSSESNAKEDLH
jgi:hypothetical protein